MPRPHQLLALVPVLLAVGCGGSGTPETKFIAQSRAADLQEAVDGVEQDLEASRCGQAAAGVTRMRTQVDAWPDRYDTRLVSNVLQWIDRVEARIEVDCGEDEKEQTPTPTETPDPTSTPTATEAPSATPTPSETPTPSATPEPDVPDVPDVIPTVPPSGELPDNGGASPDEEG